MPFDLSSASPVEEPKEAEGFDLGSAKPVGEAEPYQRGAILPFVRQTPTSSAEFGMPGVVKSAIEAFQAPGKALGVGSSDLDYLTSEHANEDPRAAAANVALNIVGGSVAKPVGESALAGAKAVAKTGAKLLGKESEGAVARRAAASTEQDRVIMERLGKARELPVPVRLTKGQAERNPEQLRNEEMMAQTNDGLDIRALHIEQNRALLENLDVIKERAAPKSKTPEDVGRRVAQDKQPADKTAVEGALSKAERRSKENVSRLYRIADASTERNRPVTPQPMIDWLSDNGAAAASVPEIVSVANTLKKFGAVEFDETGKAVAKRDLTIGEMEEIRKLAVKLQQPGTPAGYYMGDLKRMIDWTTQDSGGDLYKAARSARNKHALQYEEPQVIAKLLTDKTRTDRTVAFEDIWDRSVLRGSVSDLERLRSTLLTQGDRRTRDAGRKAWRDISASTIEYIKGEATKSVSVDSFGNPNISPAALKRAVDRIGERKLDILLGQGGAEKVGRIVEVAQDVKTLPPYKGGSTTVPNALSLGNLVSQAEKIPFLGPLGSGAANLVKSAYKAGERKRDVQEAVNYPSAAKKKKKAE